MKIKHHLIALVLLLCGFSLNAQVVSRSGVIPPSMPTPEFLPCTGTAIFSEDFESGMPAGFSIIDNDANTPRPEMSLTGGWQLRQDYRDTNNTVMVSPSWYTPADTSDDWLILPQITPAANTCFGWMAYSQDPFFPEGYEVRISTTTPTISAFLANAPLDTIYEEDGDKTFHNLSLGTFAGTPVYIAFRQVTYDGFALVIDDILTTNYISADAGVYEIRNITADPGDTILIKGAIANYGTDTLRSVDVLYNVDGGSNNNMQLTGLALAPDDTLWFVHTADYPTDTVPHIYTICAWTANPNGVADQKTSNDTTCVLENIGNFVSAEKPFSGNKLNLWPNPASDAIYFSVGIAEGNWQLFTAEGRILSSGNISSERQMLNLSELPAGIYLLKVTDDHSRSVAQRFIKN